MANMTSLPVILIILLTIAGVTSCSELLKATDGDKYLETPGYDSWHMYHDNMNDAWTIEAEGIYHNVEISELQFSIYDCGGCNCDYLEFIDGDSDEGKSLGKYCGNSYGSQTTVTSTGKYMYIKFVSDAYFTDRGFHIRYRRVEDTRVKTWMIVGITLTVLIVMMSISLIVYLCYKKHSQVKPINTVHYIPGNVQYMPQVVWSTPPQRIVLPPYPGHVVEPDGRNVVPLA